MSTPTDDTPRDPLAAQPLTDEETRALVWAVEMHPEDFALPSEGGPVGWAFMVPRLLATLDATRPSGDDTEYWLETRGLGSPHRPRPSGDEALHAEKRVAAGLSITDRERAALRPSGDEALAQRIAAAMDEMGIEGNRSNIAMAREIVVRAALATQSSAPDHTRGHQALPCPGCVAEMAAEASSSAPDVEGLGTGYADFVEHGDSRS